MIFSECPTHPGFPPGFLCADSGLPPDLVHMAGAAAPACSRIRYMGSDSVRTVRQQNVLSSLWDAYTGSSMTAGISLLNDLFPLLTADITGRQMIVTATKLIPAARHRRTLLADDSLQRHQELCRQ